jgi:MFS family permease
MEEEIISKEGSSARAAVKFNWSRFLKGKQWVLLLLVRLAVLFFSGRYLYFHVIRSARFEDIFSLSYSILHSSTAAWLFFTCLVMVLLNWGIEALKWQYLLHKFADISFVRSFAAILSGSAISLWMPNRVGEYIGRVMFLDSSVRIKSIFATFVGSIAQVVVTLILGTIGYAWYQQTASEPVYFHWIAMVLTPIAIFLLVFFYFNLKVLRSWLPVKRWTRPLRKYLKLYKHYSARELEKVLWYSLLRYFIFSIQFYLLLLFFGIHVPVIQGFMLIFLMYLIQTVSPTNGFTELVVRGGTTVFLFGSFTTNATAILAASYSLWFINLMVPGIIGAVIFGFSKVYSRKTA